MIEYETGFRKDKLEFCVSQVSKGSWDTELCGLGPPQTIDFTK